MEPWLGYIMTLNYDTQSPAIIESNRLLAMCEENEITAERVLGKKEWVYDNAISNAS